MSAPRRTARLSPVGPTWTSEFRAGKAPAKGTPAWSAFLGWYFFGDVVEGLPRYESPEGLELIARLPDEVWA